MTRDTSPPPLPGSPPGCPRAGHASLAIDKGKNQSPREALQTEANSGGLEPFWVHQVSCPAPCSTVPGVWPQPHMPSAHMQGGPGAPDFSRNSAAGAFILKSGTGPRTVGGDPGKGTGQSWPLPMPAWWRRRQRELWRLGKCYHPQELFLGLSSKALTVSDLGGARCYNQPQLPY